MFDVLIIGSGPAGISAALTLQSRGCRTAIASMMGSYLTGKELPRDYYGLEELTGEEVYLRGVRQARHAGIAFWEEQITGLAKNSQSFTAAGKSPVEATCVILATGKPAPYTLPDFAQCQNSVHLRAEEAGFLYRNRMVGVLGNGSYAIAQGILLARFARTVTLFTNGEKIGTVPGTIGVNHYTIDHLGGQERLERIVFDNGTRLNLDGLFLANRTADAADLCAGVGAVCDGSTPQTDHRGATSVEGLFAAGDCTGKTKTLQEQTFDGHRVALTVCDFLKKQPYFVL